MIVVAGVTNVQFSVPVEGFPLEYAPVHYPQGKTGVSVGGVGFNVAAGLAALGGEVRLATFAGGDLLGGGVVGELRARGLYGPWVAGGQETPRSVVLHEPGGERMIHTDLRGLPEAVYPAGMFADAVRGAAYAVVTNIGFARPLLGVARAAGVPVAADVQAVDDVDDGYNRESNVAQHEVAVAVELEDGAEAVRLARSVRLGTTGAVGAARPSLHRPCPRLRDGRRSCGRAAVLAAGAADRAAADPASPDGP